MTSVKNAFREVLSFWKNFFYKKSLEKSHNERLQKIQSKKQNKRIEQA